MDFVSFITGRTKGCPRKTNHLPDFFDRIFPISCRDGVIIVLLFAIAAPVYAQDPIVTAQAAAAQADQAQRQANSARATADAAYIQATAAAQATLAAQQDTAQAEAARATATAVQATAQVEATRWLTHQFDAR